MTARCRICAHEQRASIDTALVKGDSTRLVATRHGVSQSAIARHSAHAATVTQVRAEVEAKRQRSVLERVRELSAEVGKQFDAASAVESLTAAEASRELGRLLELEAKLTGELAPKRVEQTTTVQLMTPREALDYMERMMPVLRAQAEEDEKGATH